MSQKPPAKPQPAAKSVPPARPSNRPAPAVAAPASRPAAKPAPAAASQSVAREEHADENDAAPSTTKFILFNAMPSWLVSMIFHVVLLLLLALLTFGPKAGEFIQEFTMGPNDEEVEEIEDFEEVEIQELDVETTEVEFNSELMPVETEVDTPQPDVSPANDVDAAALQVNLDPLGDTTAPKNDMLAQVGAFTGSALDGRGSAQARKAMAKAAGGNDATEAAVALALKWIASRQAADGGWSFNHNLSMNPRPCPDPGKHEKARNGATGLALLPFLGAGQTHKEGTYKDQVRAGLAYLIRNMKVKGQTGSWHESEGRMYSHGIAAIAMCEAYAMTHDKELLVPAQLGINFIVYAQDPVGGGWRYAPKDAGDTSAVGWQLMALKSGHMAYLQVPKGTILGAVKFLDSVQADSGAAYGYTGPGRGESTTAVGLLSRMYLGWKQDNPALQRGVESLDKTGPKIDNMYYSYYATQVMRHNEGEAWKRWNHRMRDPLVASQGKEGVTAGSWYFPKGEKNVVNDLGGRLYCTAMATMMLEVYYRHLPIYRKQAAEEDFPL